MNTSIRIFLICFSPLFSFCQWETQTISAQVSYRSIDTDENGCIWAGGSSNTISLSCDGGNTWSSMKVGGDAKLDFRGIAVLNENEVVAMSAGLGSEGAAKIYKTTDKGKTWNLVYSSQDENVFMDGMKFFNEKEGIVYGDPIGSKFFAMKTTDGGMTWNSISQQLPDILEGEASYAASNSNIAIHKDMVWIATQSRIFESKDKGKTWHVLLTPFKSGKTAGIFGLYLNGKHGFAVGGDYVKDKNAYENTLFKKLKGKDWETFYESEPVGLKEAVLPLTKSKYLLIGTSGTSLFDTKTRKSRAMDTESFHTGVCDANACYAIGGKGHFGIWRKK